MDEFLGSQPPYEFLKLEFRWKPVPRLSLNDPSCPIIEIVVVITTHENLEHEVDQRVLGFAQVDHRNTHFNVLLASLEIGSNVIHKNANTCLDVFYRGIDDGTSP